MGLCAGGLFSVCGRVRRVGGHKSSPGWLVGCLAPVPVAASLLDRVAERPG
jgi:hypothetical protein